MLQFPPLKFYLSSKFCSILQMPSTLHSQETPIKIADRNLGQKKKKKAQDGGLKLLNPHLLEEGGYPLGVNGVTSLQ